MNIPNYLKSLFVLLIAFQSNCLPAQTKHALIVAIGDYKYWSHISSSNDVPFIKSTLLKQDFEETNITVLTDAEATIDGIENAFKNLISEVKPGDIVWIHFSSHGEQVEDDGNDETDGLDETIVTYDAVKPKNSTNFKIDQAKYFRDDAFGKYIDQIRKKLGRSGDVVAFMDACHSGTGSRGSNKVRGGEPPLTSKNFKAPVKDAEANPNVFQEGNAANEDESKLATYVVISAARAEELNNEISTDSTGDMGSLSYAVSKVFETLSPGTTYRSLFSNILTIMNDEVPQQHPVMEGNGIDRVLFDNRFVEQKPFINIEEINGNSLTLKGGLMMGLDIGAKVALYPAGTNDPAKATPLASGTITGSSPFTSIVELDKDPGLKQPAAGLVFITEPSYNIKPLVIKMGSAGSGTTNFSEEETETIKNILKEMPLVTFTGNPELLLLKGTLKDTLKIAGNGYVFCTVKAGDKKDLQEQVRRYAQYKFLQKLQITDPTANLDVKLIPFLNGKAEIAGADKKMVNGIFEINVGDSLLIWAKNKGKKAVYLNILDLQPDGIINPIFPNTITKPVITPEELKIEAGKEILFQRKIIIGPPTGMEIFKIFVSETEINMEGIAKTKGASPRANLNVLERLLNNSYNIASRGADVQSEQKAEGSTYDLLFRIKPAKK
ncbi:MAG TPA: caspase family protein [Panacibacter sp.]|nr:caspase family protein [Panacibacter sp.]